jgi:hypothetical protein
MLRNQEYSLHEKDCTAIEKGYEALGDPASRPVTAHAVIKVAVCHPGAVLFRAAKRRRQVSVAGSIIR